MINIHVENEWNLYIDMRMSNNDDEVFLTECGESVISYVKTLYKDITGKEVTCSIKFMDGTDYMIISGESKERNLLMNIVHTLKLRSQYLSDDEFELEESTGSGSKYNRGGTSYLTH